MITVYGLKNCDTCRAARKWLNENSIEHTFHDVRGDGLDEKTVTGWEKSLGWETLLNRRGTTWRKLDDADKEISDAAAAVALMVAHPALIKRPVFDLNGEFFIGFKQEQQDAILSAVK